MVVILACERERVLLEEWILACESERAFSKDWVCQEIGHIEKKTSFLPTYPLKLHEISLHNFDIFYIEKNLRELPKILLIFGQNGCIFFSMDNATTLE